MARSAKPRSFRVKQSVDVEVTQVPFTPFESLKSLDVKKLERAARAVVELGHFESDCCKRIARAIVKKGKVTEVTLDPCTDAKPAKPSRDVEKLLKLAKTKLKVSKATTKKLPMSVAGFFGGLRAIISIDIPVQWTCSVICVTIFGHTTCFTCCTTTTKGGGQSTTCR